MNTQSDLLNSIETPRGNRRGFLLIIAIMVVVVSLLTSCATPPVDNTEVPPEPSSEVTEPSTSSKPDGAQECPGQSGSFNCSGISEHEINLTNVPEKAFPNVLPVSSEREQELRQAEKEEIGCIFAIAGDLAFYDTDNKLVTEFKDSPITITFSLNDKDIAEFEACKQTLVEQQIVTDPTVVEFQPTYFSETWKPFPEGSYRVDGNVVTVTITTWGDQPLGGGTKP